ncbi:MAG: putative bifunctional diguanylate cyclase/phosphodiesterase [Myxococcota bacterium]
MSSLRAQKGPEFPGVSAGTPTRVLIATQADATGGALTRVLAMVDPSEFSVEFSESLESAFSLVANENFDAIVLSLQMPEGEGRQAIERVMPILGHVPSVAVLDHADPDVLAFALESGVQRVLTQQTLSEESFRDALLHARHLHALWSELRAARTRDRHLASHDSLTGVYNRRWLQQHLPGSLTRARFRHGSTGILFIDLDGFKEVNDSLGHAAGDQMLVEIARRITAKTRRTDAVVRMGGDEFVVVLNRIDEQGAEVAAREIADAVAKPVLIAGREEWITASIGIGIAPVDGDTMREVLRNADAAMYQAKAVGKNRVLRFQSDLAGGRGAGYDVVRGLHQAITKEELCIFLQPQVNLDSGELVGAEALVRWNHPVEGLILPWSFIPAAEQAGLMNALGDFVLDKACAALGQWVREGRDLRMSVNVAAQQLVDRDIVDGVARRIKQFGFLPHQLELEITETSVLSNTTEVQETLKALSYLGVRIALDDFGTGYSSLSVFWQIPMHRVKIDQSFVRSSMQNETAQAIVLSVLHLSATRQIEVIAEGIEEIEQAEMLMDFGCNEMQGYLFGRPMPVADFNRYLADAKSPWASAISLGGWR